jgi:hypothetical protein
MRMCVAISKVRRMLTLLPHNAKLNLFKTNIHFKDRKFLSLEPLHENRARAICVISY